MLNLNNYKILKNKLFKGGAVIGFANASEQGLRFIRNMILTRILAPEVFGIMAIVLAINAFLDSFTEVGIKQAIIHHEQARENLFLNTAWWFATLRSLILYALAFLIAPAIANFYDNPEIVSIMRLAFLAILFKGMMSIRSYVAVKDLKFNRWAVINHGGGIIGIVIAVLLAFYLKNIWALVIGFTAESFFRFTLSYIICPFLPSFSITRENFYALYKYAMGMLGLPILTFIFMRIDVFVIGKLHSEYDLGLYSMSVTLAYVPLMFLSSVISDIAMPHFASLQKKNSELRKALIKVTYLITYFSFPIVVFILVYSESILIIIYGKEYAAVSIAFSILAVTAFLRLLSVPIAGMYMAIGEPGKHRFFTIIRASLMIMFIYPAVKYFGLVGGASAGLTAILVGFVLQLNKLKEIISLNKKKYIMSLVPAACFSSLIIIIWVITNSFTTGMPLREILAGLASCIIVYLLIIGIQIKTKKLFF